MMFTCSGIIVSRDDVAVLARPAGQPCDSIIAAYMKCVNLSPSFTHYTFTHYTLHTTHYTLHTTMSIADL